MTAIVLGTDGSPGAEAAVQKAIELAGGSGVTVHLACAYPTPSALERVGMTAKQDPTDLSKLSRHAPTSLLIVRRSDE